MLDELGPTFVKFGQLLSTRPDVVPPDIIASCAALQDDVRPFPFAARRAGDRGGARRCRSSSSSSSSRSSRSPRRRSARCTARRCRTAAASPSRCSGPDAPRQIEADLALLYQAAPHREGARARARLHRRARSSSTSSRARSGRSSTTALEGAQRRRVPSQLRRPPARPRAARLLELHAQPRADARVPRRRSQLADVDPADWTLEERRRLAYLIDRGVDDDDLPARVLPRRPASGEHPRARRADQIGLVDFGAVGKLTDDDMSKLTRLFIDAANENVDALPRAAGRPRRPLPEGARGGVRAPSCARSTTATTARASPRSTRCR